MQQHLSANYICGREWHESLTSGGPEDPKKNQDNISDNFLSLHTKEDQFVLLMKRFTNVSLKIIWRV